MTNSEFLTFILAGGVAPILFGLALTRFYILRHTKTRALDPAE